MRWSSERASSTRRVLIIGILMLANALGPMPVVASGAPGQMMWWEIKSPMPVVGRSRAVGEIGGLLYVLGGRNITQRVDIYNPANDTWTTPGYTLTNPVQSNAVAVRNGIMYVVTDTQLIGFDPTRVGSKDWVVTALAVPTQGARADIWNDTIYITGGSTSIQAVELDPTGQTGVPRVVTTLPYWVRYAPTFVSSGSLFVCGGQLTGGAYTDLGWRLPINAGHGAEGPLQATVSFPLARLGQSPQPFSNGHHYLATGKPFVDTMDFDPAGPTWTVIGSVPTPRFTSSVESYQDKLYTIGGADESDVDVNSTEVGHLENCRDIYADSHGTPAGGTVNVTVDGYAVSVTFPTGTDAGPFTCAVMNSAPHPYPAGFQTNGKVFEIASGSGNIAWPVTITLPYNGSTSNPKVLHWNGSGWDITTGIGTRQYDVRILAAGGGTITFEAWSMSPFVAGDTPPTTSPASSAWSIALLGAFAFGLAYLGRSRLRVK